jgi:hypothetical protein
MLRILKFLFTGVWHSHKWKTISEGEIQAKPNLTVVTIGHKYVLQCEHCGEMKTFKSKVTD